MNSYLYVCIFLYMRTLTRLSKEIGNYLIRNSSKMVLIYYEWKNGWSGSLRWTDNKETFPGKTRWSGFCGSGIYYPSPYINFYFHVVSCSYRDKFHNWLIYDQNYYITNNQTEKSLIFTPQLKLVMDTHWRFRRKNGC